MLIATPLIGMSFGPMSEYLLSGDTFPPCKTLSRLFHQDK